MRGGGGRGGGEDGYLLGYFTNSTEDAMLRLFRIVHAVHIASSGAKEELVDLGVPGH